MLLLISPAKTLDFTPSKLDFNSQPELLDDSERLNKKLRSLSTVNLQKLMGISEKIADSNVVWNQSFKRPFTSENAKQALLAFKGDVYQGMMPQDFSEADFEFAQQHLGILSGLYGYLRPMDLMQPYRLEMGTKLKVQQSNNLYQFWNDKVTQKINQNGASYVVNLASNEYFKVVQPKQLSAQLWTVNFKEWRKDKFKVISFSAKRARGMMCRYVIKNRLSQPEQMIDFKEDNYQYNPSLSGDKQLTFTR
jgi:hypothetical protein